MPQKLASVIDRITDLREEIEAGRHPGRAVWKRRSRMGTRGR